MNRIEWKKQWHEARRGWTGGSPAAIVAACLFCARSLARDNPMPRIGGYERHMYDRCAEQIVFAKAILAKEKEQTCAEVK